MSYYEGVVAEVKENGKAVVVLRPDQAGIAGAPHVRVFHPPTPGSQVAVEAVNAAKAAVGDRVSVIGSSHRWWANACKLIGIPLVGLVAGFGSVAWVLDAGASATMKAVGAFSGLLLGVVAGVAGYFLNPRATDLVIGAVIGKGDE
jgi:hypothetical protein